MSHHFNQLINAFCSLSGLRDPESIGRGVPMEVNGITCSITACRQDDVDGVILYVDFGAVPLGRESAIYEELLVQNYVGAPDAGVMFSYSPIAKSVVAVQHLRANEVTPQRLVDILTHMAEKAGEWRQTYFLKTSKSHALGSKTASAGATRALLGTTSGAGSGRLGR